MATVARAQNLSQRRFTRVFAKTLKIIDRPVNLSLFKIGLWRQARDPAPMPCDNDRFAALHGGQKFRQARLCVGGLHFSHDCLLDRLK